MTDLSNTPQFPVHSYVLFKIPCSSLFSYFLATQNKKPLFDTLQSMIIEVREDVIVGKCDSEVYKITVSTDSVTHWLTHFPVVPFIMPSMIQWK